VGNAGVRTNKGVPQGNITSPLLFNIATESLIEELERKGIKTYMYADDTALLCKDRQQLN